MDTYGLVKTTFADEIFFDMEPVGDDFIGVKYHLYEEVERKLAHLRKMDSTKFYQDQLDSRQVVIRELHEILIYWKESYFELREKELP